MNVIKGLSRLQSNLESILSSAENLDDQHLSLLKRCHEKITLIIKDPASLDACDLEQLAVALGSRPRANDKLPERAYDEVVVGLSLLANMRRRELEQAYGPESAGSASDFKASASELLSEEVA